MALMHCPKCTFEDDSTEEVRIHALYQHQCYLPQCSTVLAKQDNLDYDAIRYSYAKLRNRIQVNRNLLRYIPYKWEGIVSKIRNNIKRYDWSDYQVYEHIKELPPYMRKDVIRRIKREKELNENMDIMKAYIKQEGIVI